MLQKIYNNSPIFVQNIMVSIKGWQLIKERYNSEYYKELDFLRNLDNEFEVQENRFNEFVNFIRYNSCFFNEKLKEIPDVITLGDLADLPTMDKETIRTNVHSMLTRKKNLIKMQTGGSTGKSMIYFTHPSDISRKFAYLDFFKEKHGVYKGMKRVSIGGRVIIPEKRHKNNFWRYNKPLNQLLLSAYHADRENLKYYINILNSFKPASIDGFTTVIHRLAKYILDNDLKLSFKPIAIFPTAETLTHEMKLEIQEAFNCPVRNQYASSEGAPFITENRDGKLEINPATGIFEMIHIQDNIYEMQVTGFYTTTTPLLRYKIGDSVELEYSLPENYKQSDIKIKRIIGRNNDFLYSNERGIITNVNLSTIVKEGGNSIIESQFIQKSIDTVIINLIVEDNTNIHELEKALIEKLKTRFGQSTHFEFNYVKELLKTNGGKTRFTINNITDQKEVKK